jgi:hypothetical protein
MRRTAIVGSGSCDLSEAAEPGWPNAVRKRLLMPSPVCCSRDKRAIEALYFGSSHGATSSTRRFSARPASVALELAGASSPTPAVRSRGAPMP